MHLIQTMCRVPVERVLTGYLITSSSTESAPDVCRHSMPEVCEAREKEYYSQKVRYMSMLIDMIWILMSKAYYHFIPKLVKIVIFS